MTTAIDRLRDRSAQVGRALVGDAYIRPSFSKADISTVVAAMYCLIGDGLNDDDLIVDYLMQRDCPFDRATLSFLLELFEGSDQHYSLWERGMGGTYDLLPFWPD